ncbi:MAG: DUF4869 domain-containing protein [Lachnospiraceae bacterium]
MSLRIFTDKSEIPSDMKLIDYNDLFFNGQSLADDEVSEIVMREIDKAEYNTENTFIGRDKSLGSLNKEHLSTGCKTLLNIISNPDKCFDVIECGSNALSLLPLIRNGNVLWKLPVLHYVGNTSCDIVIHNQHFTDFKKFLAYVMD